MRSSIVPALVGATYTVLGSFPVIALWAFVFGLSVPFKGEVHGWEAVCDSYLFMLFVGVLFGGFAILGVAGALGGVVVQKVSDGAKLHHGKLLVTSLVIGYLYCLALHCGLLGL